MTIFNMEEHITSYGNNQKSNGSLDHIHFKITTKYNWDVIYIHFNVTLQKNKSNMNIQIGNVVVSKVVSPFIMVITWLTVHFDFSFHLEDYQLNKGRKLQKYCTSKQVYIGYTSTGKILCCTKLINHIQAIKCQGYIFSRIL